MASEKIVKFVEEIKTLTVLELADLVKAIEEEFVITAFMCNINQCYRLYRMAGKGQVSPKLYKRITKNIERHPELFHIYC